MKEETEHNLFMIGGTYLSCGPKISKGPGGLKMKKENVISGLSKGEFWQPLTSPEAQKERSGQSFSAAHIKPRADCPFHCTAFFRPGINCCSERLLSCSA